MRTATSFIAWRTGLVTLSCTFLLCACDDGPTAPAPVRIVMLSGDLQVARVGSTLPMSLGVLWLCGVGGTAMPSWGATLTHQQLWGLAYYVESLIQKRGFNEDELGAIERPPKVFILRLRHVLALDATGLHALEELHHKCRRQGTVLVLSGVSFGPGAIPGATGSCASSSMVTSSGLFTALW